MNANNRELTRSEIPKSFFRDVRSILADARQRAYAAVNFIMVEAYWKIGRRIVEEEQGGKGRAEYGAYLIKELSRNLGEEFGRGFSVANLKNFRQFYMTFPDFEKGYALRSEVRTFVVDRIKLLKLTDEKFVLPNGFDLDEFTRRSFKVIQDELNTVKVRITPAWARYIGEKIWHESQKSHKLSDGSLELTFQVAGLDEIKQWIMSLGPEAYVEEPKKLRDMIKADMKKALVQYEGIKPAYQEPEVLENRVDYAS